MTRPTVLAYYFPSWHRDPRNAEWFGAGWTEWELVKGATARFPGHRQPRVMWANHHLVDIFPSRSADGAIPQQLKDGGLELARDFLDRRRSRHPVVTVNAWNEWTEGSYLLPDTTHGNAFLEAIHTTFGTR